MSVAKLIRIYETIGKFGKFDTDTKEFGNCITKKQSNFAMRNLKDMDSKITIPESVCSDEVVDYMASHYALTPQQFISQFLSQEGIIADSNFDKELNLRFEENEMAILRDMGLKPTYVEFIETGK